MIDTIGINATYRNRGQVPRIGDRRFMRVNGRRELLTLNTISVERRRYFDDDSRPIHEYVTQESWGGFYDVGGR